MSKQKSYEGWEAVEPRTEQYGKRKGEPVCQSRNQGGYWKGTPCGNAAKHAAVYSSTVTDKNGVAQPVERTAEVCCGTHIAQCMDRNPGTEIRPLIWEPEKTP